MTGFDFNCLLGTWPFRKLPGTDADGLLGAHSACGIHGGLVSGLSSVFYNDPYEGDQDVAEVLASAKLTKAYGLALTINPALPGWQRDIEQGCETLDAAAVRIHPSYHGYALGDVARELCAVLRACRLPLLVSARLEDDRLRHMLAFSPLGPQDIVALSKAAGDDVGVVLLGMHRTELEACQKPLQASPNMLCDISWLKNEADCLEACVAALGDDKLVLGTLYPLLAGQSTLTMLQDAGIAQGVKQKILRENGEAFLRRYGGKPILMEG